MDSAKLNDWLQVVGLFGVIASLIFVGMQMKQDRDIALSQAYQARSDQITAIMAEFGTDPTIQSALAKFELNRPQDVTPEEIEALSLWIGAVFNFYENIHFQYLNGFIDEEHWQKSRTGLKNLLVDDFGRARFRNETSSWRRSFRALAEELIAENDSEQTSQ